MLMRSLEESQKGMILTDTHTCVYIYMTNVDSLINKLSIGSPFSNLSYHAYPKMILQLN